MKIKCIIMKIAVLLMVFIAMINLGFGQERNQITGFAGLNYVMKYGSVDDYIFGENDFPVTPAHSTPVLGFSYARFFSEKMGVEVDIRYNLSTTVTLEDPSDGDTVEVDIMEHYTLTGNIIYKLSTGTIIPYIAAGAGIDMISMAEDQTIISELGYDVTIEAPERKNDFVANVGAGVNYYLNQKLGLRVDVRYFIIFETKDHPLINSLNITGGIIYRF